MSQGGVQPATAKVPPPWARRLKDSIRHKAKMVAVTGKIKFKLTSVGVAFGTVGPIIRDGADACPPLKSASGFLVSGMEAIKRAKSVKSDAQALLDRATALEAALGPLNSLSSETRSSAQAVKTLCKSDIPARATPLVASRFFRRLFRLSRDEPLIKSLERQLDEALQSFHVASDAQIGRNVGELPQQFGDIRQDIEQLTTLVSHSRVEQQNLANSLDRLPGLVALTLTNLAEDKKRSRGRMRTLDVMGGFFAVSGILF